MNRVTHAYRVGLSRGFTEWVNSLRSPQDWMFYVVVSGGAVTYLYFNRDEPVEVTGLMLPAVTLPSMLGALIVFGAYIGPLYQLAVEREDGTLLRAKAVPRGMTGYVAGQVLYQSLSMLPMLAVVLIPSLILFDIGVGAGWFGVLGYALLGLLAVLPIGMVVGSLVKGPNKIGTWGMLPILALFGTSGIFYPVQELWGWLQGVVQVFPMYWLGLGMRSAVLPDAAAAAEIGGAWRTWETIGVLGAWAVAGIILAPVVLRRMARRQSGSSVEAGRLEALKRVQ